MAAWRIIIKIINRNGKNISNGNKNHQQNSGNGNNIGVMQNKWRISMAASARKSGDS